MEPKEIIPQLPYTLSFPMVRATEAIDHGQYEKAKNLMLDFMEVGVMYVSHVLFGLLQDRPGGVSPACLSVMQAYLNTIDHNRQMSFGTWINDLLTPLLKAAEKEIAGHPLVDSMSQHLLSGRKRVNVLLGDGKGQQSIVALRNRYKGHGVTQSEEVYAEVVDRLMPHVEILLQAVSPLADAHPENDGGHYILVLPSGNGPADRLDLYPLLFYTDKGIPFVFQTLRDNETIQYVSSNEQAEMIIDDSRNRSFDERMKRILPSFDISKEMNWEEIRQAVNAESALFINQIYKEKKYNRELFVERRQLTDALHRFVDSPATLFPMVGEAGQGKTNQLSFWTETLIRQGEAVLIFNASDFANVSLDMKIKQVFGRNPKTDLMKFMHKVHDRFEETGRTLYVFFDAINECLKYANDPYSITGRQTESTDDNGPLLLYEAIRIVFAGDSFPRFKVLFTCRTYTWKNLIQPTVAADDNLIYHGEREDDTVIRGFTDSEAHEAYDIYRSLYQMATDFTDINRSVALRLKDPLILKYVCTNFLGRRLTDSMGDYTSIALFAKMLSDIGSSYAGWQQIDIVNAISDWFLDNYLSGQPVDGIDVEAVRKAPVGTPLADLAALIVKDDGITIAYGELLNKAERPMLREVEKQTEHGETTYIQFIYERFLEYVIGRRFVDRQLAMSSQPINADIFLDALQRGVTNVVFMGAMRNALLIDYLRTGDATTIMTLAARHSEDFTVMTLVNETLDTLIRENYEDELFSILHDMLNESTAEHAGEIARYNEVIRLIGANQSTPNLIAEHRQLSTSLSPLIRLRNTALVSTMNGVLLSDFFNEGLYRHDALQLVWRLMLDDILEVRNTACMYAYYLSNRRYTLSFTPLNSNLTRRIVEEMYAIIEQHSLIATALKKKVRQQSMSFLETATRLCVLLIIDCQLAGGEQRKEIAPLMDLIRGVVSHLTWNYRVVRAIMPFIQIAMRRQITFQSDYVNNAIEYQNCWDESVIPAHAPHDRWSRDALKETVAFVSFYNDHGTDTGNPAHREAAQRFISYHPAILDAYTTGDSLSYFVIERVLVIMGAANWEYVKPIIDEFFTDRFRQTQWYDYSQMSMLYNLLQIEVQSDHTNNELLAIYERECRDWTCRCRGLFPARSSEKANPRGRYKRNVLTWYGVVYNTHHGDGVCRQGDSRPVPLFYELIDKACHDHDKELLYHIIDNISELIADFGFVRTGLSLLKYIMQQFETQASVDAIDKVDISSRGGIYGYDLIRLVGNVFSTAKNYFPDEVDNFIRTEVAGLKFPGVSAYSEEILSYHPSGETLSDLFTHKFGKFLIWSLIHEPAVDKFSIEAIGQVTETTDCFSWFTRVVKILMRHMFGMKC